MISESTAAYEAICEITPPKGDEELPTAVVVSWKPLGEGFQPLLSPDDCDLAEQIVKLDAGVAKLLEERYGITDIGEVERAPPRRWYTSLRGRAFVIKRRCNFTYTYLQQ